MVALVTAVGLTALLVAPAPVSASAVAYNKRSQYLVASPNEGNRSCVSRRILLDEGTYLRDLALVEDPGGSGYEDVIHGTIGLGAGWYFWEDCLQGTFYGTYVHTQKLDPDNPNWSTSTWTFEHAFLNANGDFGWGGALELL
ncbi:hypothetical protein [Micromonospora carbonacea]|uniref:hypothetical protein n=1 Tax=Micromonospora carbonacea TaxID=47853 RepID=UPI001C87B30A|nr:hypothetical protein [Micromonospora carbonacea]